jgi:tRNA nucleotidyltransferase (CCA-adding enzyme)
LETRGEIRIGRERWDPWLRTLAVVDRAASARGGDPRADMVLMLAALTHLLGVTEPAGADAGDFAVLTAAVEAPARRLLGRLTRESGLADAVIALVRDLPTPTRLHAESRGADREVRRLALRVRIPLLLKLAQAWHEAAHPPGAAPPFAAGAWLTERARVLGVSDRPPDPLLKGRHLLELGFQPGPELGVLLREAFERQLDGTIASLDQALRWAGEELRARRDGRRGR